jgi:hypothetical protein
MNACLDEFRVEFNSRLVAYVSRRSPGFACTSVYNFFRLGRSSHRLVYLR